MTRVYGLYCLLCLCAVLGSACGGRAAKPTLNIHQGVCFAPRPTELHDSPVRAHEWLSLLVHLELGRGGVFARQDCLGRIIHPEPARTCAASPPLNAALQLDAIAEESVIEHDLGDALHAVWIVTHRFEDGEGFGPIALVRSVPDALDVLAMGTLRMATERVAFEHWPLEQATLLVASSDNCRAESEDARGQPRKQEFATCRRSAQLTMLHGDRLFEPGLFDARGQCLEGAHMPLQRHAVHSLPSGLSRIFELTTELKHDTHQIVIEEHMLIRDVDPTAPQHPAREVQRIDNHRFIQAQDGRLIARQPSLWSGTANDGLLQSVSTPGNLSIDR